MSKSESKWPNQHIELGPLGQLKTPMRSCYTLESLLISPSCFVLSLNFIALIFENYNINPFSTFNPINTKRVSKKVETLTRKV